MELDRPMVLALNMMDELTANGGTVDVNRLERPAGHPGGSHQRRQERGHLRARGARAARGTLPRAPGPPGLLRGRRARRRRPSPLHPRHHATWWTTTRERAGIPVRFAGHASSSRATSWSPEPCGLDAERAGRASSTSCSQMEAESRDLDRLAALADMRFVVHRRRSAASCVVKPHESREHARSAAHRPRCSPARHTGHPGLCAHHGVWSSGSRSAWWARGSQGLHGGTRGLGAHGAASTPGSPPLARNPVVHSLVVDGICAGVGSVLSFLPIIVVLFFLLSILEDSGYMARVAFVMDKLLRQASASPAGAIVPMLIGFGCSVPAIMSTRTLPSERDRKMTIMLTPFMSCSAKLPIYAVFSVRRSSRSAAALGHGLPVRAAASWWAWSWPLDAQADEPIRRRDPVPFRDGAAQLPPAQPQDNAGLLAWDKAKDFLTRAFTIIFVASVVIWFLQTFDIRLNVVADQSDSPFSPWLGGLHRPGLRAAGLWRLAGLLRPGLRPHRQGERHLHAHGASGRHLRRCAVRALLAAHGLRLPCVHAALPAVRGRHQHRQERAGRALRGGRLRTAGVRGLGRGLPGARGRPGAGPGVGQILSLCQPLVSRVALGRLRFSPLRHNPGRQL